MKNLWQSPWFKPVLFLVTGLLAGWLLFGGVHSHDHESDDHAGHNHASADEVWTCSMHPSVRDDGPGSCPICGMDLIPASAAEGEEDTFSMVMSESAMRLAEIQVAPVRKDRPEVRISAPGRIEADERKTASVSGHFNGRITRLHADYTGAYVEAGRPLATVYSDDLITAQRELLEAWNRRDVSPALYRATRQKLRYWDLREHQIDAVIEKGEPVQQMDILAPVSGYVTMRGVSRGDYFSSGTTLFEIADLTSVWVTADVPETDMSLLATGNTVQFTLRSMPGETHEARISWIDPQLDTRKRTVRVRADAENRDGRLKPGMLLSGSIEISLPDSKLIVPASSVLWTGPRSVVYVYDGSGDTARFEAREVTLGHRAGDFYVIEDGLEEGEEVVFHGAFKIDSEMQLADRFSMMNREPGTGAVPRGHDHGSGTDHDAHTEEVSRYDDVPDDFRAILREAVSAYIDGKEALTESNLELAQESFNRVEDRFDEIGMHGLSGSGHEAWMRSYTNMMHHLEALRETDDIEEVRSEFRFLSDELVQAVRQFGIEGVVYQQYCPMAFDDEGAYWLSREEQIANPYLPDTMLRCGEVIERIE